MSELSTLEALSTERTATTLPKRVRAPELWQTLARGLDPEGSLLRAQRRLGDVFRIRVLGEEVVVLGHPDAAREVFSHGSEQLNTGEANEPFKPIFGTRTLLLLDGEEHLARRKLILPSFHGERMRAYEGLIREATVQEISTWPLGVPMAALPRVQALSYSIILRCIFGPEHRERIRALGEAVQELLRWVADPRRIFIYFFLGPDRLMRMDGFRERKEAIERQIAIEIAERGTAEDLEGRDDILSMLMSSRNEGGEGLSETDLLDEVVTLLIVGHATTASLLAWAMHELARNPASQARMAAEPDTYVDAVISETLRLRPPLTGVVRRLREPFEIAGYRLPTGTTVMLSQQLVQRRPDLYPDPWAFKPERFLDRRPATSEWFPFGGSVRRCIGASFAQLQARIVLEEMTKTLRLTPEKSRPERASYYVVVLVPGRGARVIATAR